MNGNKQEVDEYLNLRDIELEGGQLTPEQRARYNQLKGIVLRSQPLVGENGELSPEALETATAGIEDEAGIAQHYLEHPECFDDESYALLRSMSGVSDEGGKHCGRG